MWNSLQTACIDGSEQATLACQYINKLSGIDGERIALLRHFVEVEPWEELIDLLTGRNRPDEGWTEPGLSIDIPSFCKACALNEEREEGRESVRRRVEKAEDASEREVREKASELERHVVPNRREGTEDGMEIDRPKEADGTELEGPKEADGSSRSSSQREVREEAILARTRCIWQRKRRASGLRAMR